MKSKPLFTGIAGGIESVSGITVGNLIEQSGLNTGNFLLKQHADLSCVSLKGALNRQIEELNLRDVVF